jgi:hypothetical protein
MVSKQHHKTGLLFLLSFGLLSIIQLVGTRQNGAAAELHHPSSPANVPDGWTVECVDCPRYFSGMSGNSAALDSSGFVHTTYGGDSLYYAKRPPLRASQEPGKDIRP